MKPVRSIATTLVVGPVIAFGFLAGTSHAAVTAAPAAPAMAIAADNDFENEDNDLLDILSPKSYSTNVNDIRSLGGGGYGGGGYGWGSGYGAQGYPGVGLYGGYGLRGYC